MVRAMELGSIEVTEVRGERAAGKTTATIAPIRYCPPFACCGEKEKERWREGEKK